VATGVETGVDFFPEAFSVSDFRDLREEYGGYIVRHRRMIQGESRACKPWQAEPRPGAELLTLPRKPGALASARRLLIFPVAVTYAFPRLSPPKPDRR